MEEISLKKITFRIADTVRDYEDGKFLFQEYATSLDFDLGFQGFTKELEQLNIQYNKPKGALILGYLENLPVARIGIRSFSEDKAELKRMFVQPGYRGLKAGQRLLTLAIETAKDLGYKTILLDTLATMKAAINLYRLFGFEDVPSYRFNPLPGAVFMEKHYSKRMKPS